MFRETSMSEVKFSINSEDSCVLYFYMNLIGIKKFLELTENFLRQSCIKLDRNNLLTIVNIPDTSSVVELYVKFAHEDDDGLVINVDDQNKRVYILCSEKGIKELRGDLMSLMEGLQNGEEDDISYMIPEWGGDWLLHKRIIKDSGIICHLRLYSILT